MKAKLENLLAQAEIQLTDLQKDQLIQLVQLLNKWNKAYNLTSVRDPQEMLVKHILDSIVVSPNSRTAFRMKLIRLPRLSNKTNCLVGLIMAKGRPGKPGPVPTSIKRSPCK